MCKPFQKRQNILDSVLHEKEGTIFECSNWIKETNILFAIRKHVLVSFVISLSVIPINFYIYEHIISPVNQLSFNWVVVFKYLTPPAFKSELLFVLFSFVDPDSFSSTSIAKNTKMPFKHSEMPHKTSRNNLTGAYGTRPSASGRTLLAFTLGLMGWTLAFFENS